MKFTTHFPASCHRRGALTAADEAMAHAIIDSGVAFVKMGKPDIAGGPK